MSYNPNIHHRRSIRLKGYDYSQAGAYFITICCEKKICRFGEIPVGAGLAPALINNTGQPNDIPPTAQMQLNEFGQIAFDEWLKLPERFPNFELDVFQIMPNHMHGIIVLKNVVDGDGGGQERAGASPAPTDAQNSISLDDIGVEMNATVGDIVGAYKSLVSNGCLEIYKSKNERMGKLWQRNYYENIIRDEKAYLAISNYIINNPANWKQDKFYTK